MQKKTQKNVLSVNEAKALLGIGANAMYRLLREGSIRHRRIGRKYLIPYNAVLEFLEGGDRP